jgi:hypothetical protein
MRMTLPDTYRTQVQHIQESPKFRLHPEKGLQAMPFPGYTIVTPTGESETAANLAVYHQLEKFQTQLVETLGADIFAPVPAASFHLTLADLIWDGSYRHACEDETFDARLQTQMAEIFQECQPLSEQGSVQFQVLGVMLMTRAIAICLAPTDEASYERVLKFRRSIYQNRDLIGLGIEQQYYFTPHITLGYFGAVPSLEDRWTLGDRLIALNQQWLDKDPQIFSAHQAELRKFDDMNHYYREPNWATFKF